MQKANLNRALAIFLVAFAVITVGGLVVVSPAVADHGVPHGAGGGCGTGGCGGSLSDLGTSGFTGDTGGAASAVAAAIVLTKSSKH